MGYMIFFLLFVFIFWIIHITKRVFEHTYLWQLKEYRWDRIKAYIKEGRVFSIKSLPTAIVAVLAFFAILLVWYPKVKWLYIFLMFGFGYYTYQSLSIVSSIFVNRLTRPKKSIRNLIIVGTLLTLALIPILTSLYFYNSIYRPPISGDIYNIEVVDVGDIFPREGADGLLFIPLETITVGMYFKYLFGFDLAIPVLVAIMVAFTSIFSRISRKKK